MAAQARRMKREKPRNGKFRGPYASRVFKREKAGLLQKGRRLWLLGNLRVRFRLWAARQKRPLFDGFDNVLQKGRHFQMLRAGAFALLAADAVGGLTVAQGDVVIIDCLAREAARCAGEVVIKREVLRDGDVLRGSRACSSRSPCRGLAYSAR